MTKLSMGRIELEQYSNKNIRLEIIKLNETLAETNRLLKIITEELAKKIMSDIKITEEYCDHKDAYGIASGMCCPRCGILKQY